MERNKKRKVLSKKKRKGIDEKDEYVVCDNVKILQSRTRSENTIRRNSNMHLNNLSHDTIQEQKLKQQKYTVPPNMLSYPLRPLLATADCPSCC